MSVWYYEKETYVDGVLYIGRWEDNHPRHLTSIVLKEFKSKNNLLAKDDDKKRFWVWLSGKIP